MAIIEGQRARSVVITGGDKGLGLATGRALAARGWYVVVASRDPEAGAHAVRAIRAVAPGARAERVPLDLAWLTNVRAFADVLRARDDLPPIGGLVCNAGTQLVSGTRLTADGFEETFAVNHLAHFLLANLLLPSLAPPARVVFVTSGTHDPARRTGMPPARLRAADALARPTDHPDPAEAGEGRATVGKRRYTTSKLCNILCAYELQRRIVAAGLADRIAAIAFDPGAMPGTGLARDWPAAARVVWNGILPLCVPLLRAAGLPFSSADRSGRLLADVVDSPRFGGAGGTYVEMDRVSRSSRDSHDAAAADALWQASARLTGIDAAAAFSTGRASRSA